MPLVTMISSEDEKHLDFWAAVKDSGVEVHDYRPSNSKRPVVLDTGTVSIRDFSIRVINSLGEKLLGHPGFLKYSGSTEKMAEALLDAKRESSKDSLPLDPEIAALKLYVDPTTDSSWKDSLYCVTPQDTISKVSGAYFCVRVGMELQDAMRSAIPAKREYLPWDKLGTLKFPRTEFDYFNTYVPARWREWKESNGEKWYDLSKKLPELVRECINHLVPDRHEQKYLWAWVWASLTKRADLVMILSGEPGTGKNRFKLLLRALHGVLNSSDGRVETLGANGSRFNSQLQNKTLLWFDEAHIDPHMESRIKEILNETVSIEKKGIDATDATRVYCSLVFSNNQLRRLYLPFNSRKFVALNLNLIDMSVVLPPEVIDRTSKEWDEERDTFNVEDIAQTAKWILHNGPKLAEEFPGLRYRGPKLLEIMHASMSRWQHESLRVIADPLQSEKCQLEGRLGVSWFKLLEVLKKKKVLDRTDYRDPITAREFFTLYTERDWTKPFIIEKVDPAEVSGDFLIQKSPHKSSQNYRDELIDLL